MQELTTIADWEQALHTSLDQPVIVLKHSTTCPISAGAWEEYQAFTEDTPSQKTAFYFVKVIESREVSNKIADEMNVKHESPQAILIKSKEAIWNSSHSDITKLALMEALETR